MAELDAGDGLLVDGVGLWQWGSTDNCWALNDTVYTR